MKTLSALCGVVVVIGVSASGCSSISARLKNDDRFYPGVYPGVRNTAYYLGHPEEQDMAPVILPVAVIDLPLSVALDTVLLPWDLPYWAFQTCTLTNDFSK